MHRPVRFSDLKQLGRSPAHYKAAITRPRVSTRPMRVGTVTHHLTLGAVPAGHRAVVRWDGERRGNAYKAFAEEHADDEIVTEAEWADAEPIAAAVLADPVASRLLAGTRRETALEWLDGGIACATGGIDFLGAKHFGDLKVTSNSEPDKFSRHALRMLYSQQLEFYRGGLVATGHDVSEGAFLIAVEDSWPHVVTVFEATPEWLEHGRRSISLWFEKLRACEATDFWPGYAQAPVRLELPEWATDGEGDEISDEESAA